MRTITSPVLRGFWAMLMLFMLLVSSVALAAGIDQPVPNGVTREAPVDELSTMCDCIDGLPAEADSEGCECPSDEGDDGYIIEPSDEGSYLEEAADEAEVGFEEQAVKEE